MLSVYLCKDICIIAGYKKREPAGINEAYTMKHIDRRLKDNNTSNTFCWENGARFCGQPKKGPTFPSCSNIYIEDPSYYIHNSIFSFALKAPPSLVLCFCLWQMSVTWQLDTFLEVFFFYFFKIIVTFWLC